MIIRISLFTCLALSLLGSPLAGQTPAAAARIDVRTEAAADTQLRVLVSLAARRLLVLSGAADTLLVAPVAVGSSRRLTYGARRWSFDTPPGVRSVLTKERDPAWIPPDWHYIEVARREHLRLAWVRGDTTIELRAGGRLVVDADHIYVENDGRRDEFHPGEEVVVGGTLYVPPADHPNRRVPGELGKYRLLLGDGIGIHGTPDTASIGRPVTHGCLRLNDLDLAWVYDHVPLGARVYIF